MLLSQFLTPFPGLERWSLGNRPLRGPFGVNWASPQARGLRYWWPFLQPGEANTIHEVVHGRHATFNSAMDATSWVNTEHGGRAVFFDGTANDVATVPDDDGLSLPATDCEVSFWFAASAWSSGKGLLGKWVSGSREWIIWCGTTTSNSIEFARYVATGYHPTSVANAAFYDGTPTFVCARTLANGDIDVAAWKPSTGLLKSTPDTTGGWNTSGSEPLTFGSYGVNAGPGNELALAIWDVRIKYYASRDFEVLDRVRPEKRWDLVAPLDSARAWPVATGGVSSGDLSSAGTGAGALVGASTNAGSLASAGTGGAALVGSSTWTGALASDGVGANTWSSLTLGEGDLSSAGAASVALVGAATAGAVLAADGVAAVTHIGEATASAVLNAGGLGTLLGANTTPGQIFGSIIPLVRRRRRA